MASSKAQRTFPSPEHDHRSCLADTLARAEAAFENRALKLTPLRRRVFEEIASSHDAVGAYNLLERLAKKGARLAPISVYRALDALLEAGVVHRLESRNAFFACHGRHEAARRHLYLVCQDCHAVAEVDAEAAFIHIDDAAKAQGFQRSTAVVEVTGRCAHCATASAGRD
jgi:Fur family transcriptional regulator, zinc uptake regulator